jgi:hypothetical protein
MSMPFFLAEFIYQRLLAPLLYAQVEFKEHTEAWLWLGRHLKKHPLQCSRHRLDVQYSANPLEPMPKIDLLPDRVLHALVPKAPLRVYISTSRRRGVNWPPSRHSFSRSLIRSFHLPVF